MLISCCHLRLSTNFETARHLSSGALRPFLREMDRWTGRVAVVTGASAGIGAAIAQELVKHGMVVVGIARRVDRVEAMKKELKGAKGKLCPLKADVSKEEEVAAAFQWIKEHLKGVDVLVNNAGIAGTSTLADGPVTNWKKVLDLNVLGLSMCTREALQSMKERRVDDGHIFHINSINGHGVPAHAVEYGCLMYTATKNAVTALTEGLRRELVQSKSKIRVTSISPGMVRTEIIAASDYKLPEGMTADQLYDSIPHLNSKDISDAVVYALGAPSHVQIHEITIKPIGEPF